MNTQTELLSVELVLGFPSCWDFLSAGFPSCLSEQELRSWLTQPLTTFQNNRLGSVAATVLFLKVHVS